MLCEFVFLLLFYVAYDIMHISKGGKALKDVFINPIPSASEPISLCSCGYGYCNNSSKRPHIREEYIIHSTESGTGYFEVDNKVYTLKKGDAFVIYPGQKIKYYSDDDSSWLYAWIAFSGTYAEGYLDQAGFSSQNPIIRNVGGEPSEITKRCLQYAEAQSCSTLRLSAFVLEFLAKIQEAIPHQAQMIPARERYVAAAISYMKLYYKDFINISSVADYLGLNRSYFYKIFKASTGISPIDYLSRIRIEKAKQLIASGESIGAAASAVGISDIYYFSRLFSKITGISPSEYKKNI